MFYQSDLQIKGNYNVLNIAVKIEIERVLCSTTLVNTWGKRMEDKINNLVEGFGDPWRETKI